MPCISVVFRDVSDKESLEETFQAVPSPRASRNRPEKTFNNSLSFAVLNSIFDLSQVVKCIHLFGGIKAPER